MFLERVFQERRFVFLERRSSGAVLLERSVLCSKNAVLCSWNACSKNAVLCSWNACSKNACSRSTQPRRLDWCSAPIILATRSMHSMRLAAHKRKRNPNANANAMQTQPQTQCKRNANAKEPLSPNAIQTQRLSHKRNTNANANAIQTQ